MTGGVLGSGTCGGASDGGGKGFDTVAGGKGGEDGNDGGGG